MVNSSSRAAGSRSESSRRKLSIPSASALPRGQARPVRRLDEHPHHELARLDRRVVAVLQQHGPPHRARGETLPHLVVDDPFDHGLLGPFHGASTRIRSPRVNDAPRVTVPARNVSGV